MDLSGVFDYVQKNHRSQNKNLGELKGISRPFIYHPIAVAALVLKYEGNNAQVAAALLHDTICDPSVTYETISSLFGVDVARLCFSFLDPETPSDARWQDIKKAYLQKLTTLQNDALLVIACEELHEGTELLHDLRYFGPGAWKRFPVHGMDVFWYYRELLAVFHAQLRDERYRPLVSEFAGVLKALKAIVFEGNSA